jgi:hypothetical protein
MVWNGRKHHGSSRRLPFPCGRDNLSSKRRIQRANRAFRDHPIDHKFLVVASILLERGRGKGVSVPWNQVEVSQLLLNAIADESFAAS